MKQLWTVCSLCNSRKYPLFFFFNNHLLNYKCAKQNKTKKIHRGFSQLMIQYFQPGGEIRHVWWWDHVSVGEGSCLGAGQCPPPSTHRPPSSILPSIHRSLLSYLALFLSLSPPPRPPTFLTAGLLSCRYLPGDKRIY